MKRKVLVIPVLLIVILSLVACEGMMLHKEDLPQTPRDKASYFMGYYLAQKADYKARLAAATAVNPETGAIIWRPEVPKIEKNVIKVKYRFLREAEQPISLYDKYVNEGKVPTVDIEIAINVLISRLEQALVEASQ